MEWCLLFPFKSQFYLQSCATRSETSRVHPLVRWIASLTSTRRTHPGISSAPHHPRPSSAEAQQALPWQVPLFPLELPNLLELQNRMLHWSLVVQWSPVREWVLVGCGVSGWGLGVAAAWSFWPSWPALFSLTISSSIFFKRRRLRVLKLSMSNTATHSGPSGIKLKAFPTIATWRAKSPRRTSEIYSPEDFQGWNPENMFKRINPLTLYPVTMVFRFQPFVLVQHWGKGGSQEDSPHRAAWASVICSNNSSSSLRYCQGHDCTYQKAKGPIYLHFTSFYQAVPAP